MLDNLGADHENYVGFNQLYSQVIKFEPSLVQYQTDKSAMPADGLAFDKSVIYRPEENGIDLTTVEIFISAIIAGINENSDTKFGGDGEELLFAFTIPKLIKRMTGTFKALAKVSPTNEIFVFRQWVFQNYNLTSSDPLHLAIVEVAELYLNY